MSTEKLSALRAAHCTDFIANKDPKCPHCGEVVDIMDNELWQLYDDQDQDIECPNCGHDFHVQVHVSYSYSTDDQPEPEEDESDAEGASHAG